jgi:DNA polymerase III epsilon subunit-like protein
MRIFWFDCETSGLNPEKDQIIQLAYILTDVDFNEISSGSWYVDFEKPDEVWSAEAEKVHGISLQKLREEGITSEQLMENIIQAVGHEGLPPIPAGHNVQFDLAFLRNLFPRWMFRNLLGYHPIDSMTLAQALNFQVRKANGQWLFPSVNLGSVCKVLKIDPGKAHCAISDVRASMEVYKKLNAFIFKDLGKKK